MPQPKCRILCIDDHEDTSEMLKLLLAQEDYEVKTALSVREAVALATSQEFDLYVFDKHLPDGNGLELYCDVGEDGLERIRRGEAAAFAPLQFEA